MTDRSRRTPEQIHASHGAALVAEDLDAIVANYAPDAVFITPTGPSYGHDGVRAGFARLFADLPHARWNMQSTVFAANALLLEWTAESDRNNADNGVDSFFYRDGLIQAQTVRYVLYARHELT